PEAEDLGKKSSRFQTLFSLSLTDEVRTTPEWSGGRMESPSPTCLSSALTPPQTRSNLHSLWRRALYKSLLTWAAIMVMFVASYQFFNAHQPPLPSAITYSQLAAYAQADEIGLVQFRGEKYFGHLRDGTEFETAGPGTPPDGLLRQLDEHKVSYWFVPGGPQDWDRIGIAVLIITLIVLNAMILVELRRGPEA
ncbi:MAG TPA: hypothetical protein VMB50_15060, partial [Myxococcales bacterium]|nr:hypothetical protein [Myxococcales bacterium]